MSNIVPYQGDVPLPNVPTETASAAPSATSPILSIVTPVLNRVDWIGDAIDSVMAQDCDRIEHIVVDGGSTDGTLDVLARYPHLRVVEYPGSDSNEAMNRGVEEATGEILGFLASDDRYGPGTLKAAASFFAAAAPHTLSAQCRAFIVDKTERGHGNTISEIVHLAEPTLQLFEILYGTPGLNSWFFRREVFERYSAFDTSIDVAADRDFMLRILRDGHYPAQLEDGSYYYAMHPGSRTLDSEAKLSERILQDHILLARKFLNQRVGGAMFRRQMRKWHALEARRLIGLRWRQGRLDSVISESVRGMSADPLWPFRLASARQDCDRMSEAAHAIARARRG